MAFHDLDGAIVWQYVEIAADNGMQMMGYPAQKALDLLDAHWVVQWTLEQMGVYKCTQVTPLAENNPLG